jgi:short-subunit dehydrogenase
MRHRYGTALVTGASSGIGREIARQLAARGADVVVVARRADRLHDLADELTGRGVEIEVLAADLGTDDGLAAVEQRLSTRPVELLVNNAGVGDGGPFHAQPLDSVSAQVRVNVLALVRLTHAALPPMVAARHGGVLNVSSLAGDQPLRGFAAYAASKSFVTTFSESVAAELRGTGVHVTVLKPGYVWTEMTPHGPDPTSLAGRFWLRAEDVAGSALDAVERGRLSAVPGIHWRAVNELVNALPHQLVRTFTARFDAS